MDIRMEAGGLRVSFRVNADGTVELADFSAAPGSGDMPPLAQRPRQFLAAQVTGESSGNFRANKHDAGSVGKVWRYVRHEIAEDPDGRQLVLSVKAPDGLAADYHMQLYRSLPVARTWAVLRNGPTSRCPSLLPGKPVPLLQEGIGEVSPTAITPLRAPTWCA